MIIFGWLVLTAVAVFVTFAGLVAAYVGLGFRREVSGEAWFFLIIGALLFFVSYYNFPFVVMMK